MKTQTTLALAIALALVAGVQAQQARDQIAAPARTGTAVISGTVVTDEQTPQPIRRATVTVVNADGTVNRRTFTDEAGRFSLPTLPEGRYTLSASKSPYLRTSYGARRADLPGTPITLKDGHHMTDVALRLTRGGVLSGRITDENGEPAFGVTVRVLQLRVQFGERTFVPAPGAGSTIETTDDRGIYRLFGLPPGEYAITASPRVTPGEVRAMTEGEIRAVMQALQQQRQQQQAAAQAAQQRAIGGQQPPVASVNPAQAGAASQNQPGSDVEKVTVAYAPVYYPGTTVAATAGTVTIAAGEERTGVDFPLRLVRTTTVEGMVVLPPGIGPQNVQLMMVPSSSGANIGIAGLEAMAMQRATVGADGKFTYTAVPPGQYTISARATKPAAGAGAPPPPPPPPGPPGSGAQVMTFTRVVGAGGGGEPMMDMIMMGGEPGGAQYWAMADVPVDGTPISGVTLALQPGMTITGKVEFRSSMTRPGGDFKRVQLNLLPAPTGGGLRISTTMPSVQIDETGRFTITGVTPGRYRLGGNAPVTQGSGPGPAWRLGSAVIKGRDVLDFMLDVAPNEDIADAVVTFIDTTQEVKGSLQDATGRPAPDYTIVVFAADKAYWTPQSRRVRTTRPSTDGKFSVPNLPPGDYRMAAVVDVSPSEINDPAFLEQLIGLSYAIKLGPGEQKTQDLKISGGL